MIRRNVAFLTAAVFFSSVGSLHAQSTEKDQDADRLFKEGQKLMEERKFADACPKLESAYKKDQQLGTLLNVAYCHKEMGSTWIAWTEFREAETKALELKRNDRRDFARERMKELEKNLSKLIIDPSSKVDLYEVDVEDRRIFDAEKGIAFAAEPGQRKVTFKAKGKKPATTLVTVGTVKESKTQIQHVQVPEMSDEDPVPVTPDPVTPTPTPQPTPPPADTNQSTWSTQKAIAVVAAGVGVVAIIPGAIFGLKVLNSPCHTNPTCGADVQTATNERNDASSAGTISTISFVGAGIFLAGAAALWFTAPSKPAQAANKGPTISADLGPTWAGIHGSF